MKTINKETFLNMLAFLADDIIKNEQYFCDLDSVAGDGDFGSSIAKGFKEVEAKWHSLNQDDIGSIMRSSSMIIMEKCGGASGPIWGKAFLMAGRSAKGKQEMDLTDLSDFFQGLVDGVQKAGKAQLGDKTLLDSLIPFTESLKKGAESDACLETAIQEAVKKAEEGAESTKTIIASKGRARYLGERSLGAYDAGAKAVSVLMSDLYQQFFQN
ncbi:MAG: dihydroxyacetone kinase subunit DhaL [Thermotogota bacterium]|nr:dihydroxyacetone kinase subunit DhaL [Thermotogota bacterium]